MRLKYNLKWRKAVIFLCLIGGIHSLQASSPPLHLSPITKIGRKNLKNPFDVTVDPFGELFVSDTDNRRVKKWSSRETIFKNPVNQPFGITSDSHGNIYIADVGNKAIRKWDRATKRVTTIIDKGPPALYKRDILSRIRRLIHNLDPRRLSPDTWLERPYKIAVDSSDNVYIADSGRHSIKKWSAGKPSLIVRRNQGLSFPFGLATDRNGDLYIADTGNSAIKKIVQGDSLRRSLIRA